MALSVIGCELVVDVDVPAYPPTLAINSFPEAGAAWQAYVTSALPVLSSAPFDETGVDDGTVEVFHNGERLVALTYRPSFSDVDPYVADGPAVVPGQTYTLRASAPGYPTAEATTTVPVPAPLDTLGVRFADGPNVTINDLRADLRITDRPDHDTYFFLALRIRSNQSTFNLTFEITDAPFQPVTVFGDNEVSGLFFTDATFRNQSVDFSIQTNVAVDATTEVILYTVDEAYYRYHTTLRDQQDTRDNPFAEPVPVFSNVRNGLGIVAGLAAAPAIIIAPRPLIRADVAGTYQVQQFTYSASLDSGSVPLATEPEDFALTLGLDGHVEGRLRLGAGQWPPLLSGYDGSFTGTYTIEPSTKQVQLSINEVDALNFTLRFSRCSFTCRALSVGRGVLSLSDFPLTSLLLVSGDLN
ncbi:MAG: DUF4249 domain-containing protein [Bacteroidota bacterium]